MKLTLEHYGEKITVETKHDDISINEVFQLVRKLLISTGFHQDNVDAVIKPK